VAISMGNHPPLHPSLKAVTLVINKRTYHLQVSDEYDDLLKDSPLLNFVVVFMELAELDDSKNFEGWCQLHHLKTTDQTLESYYGTISSQLDSIRSLFPNQRIDYFVSDLDYQLSAGAVQQLKQNR